MLNILVTAKDLPLSSQDILTSLLQYDATQTNDTTLCLQCLWLERANMWSQEWAERINVFIMDKNIAHSSHHVMWQRLTRTASGQSKFWTFCSLHIDASVYISTAISVYLHTLTDICIYIGSSLKKTLVKQKISLTYFSPSKSTSRPVPAFIDVSWYQSVPS